MNQMPQSVPSPFPVARVVVGEEGVNLILFALVVVLDCLFIPCGRFPVGFADRFDVVGRLLGIDSAEGFGDAA